VTPDAANAIEQLNFEQALHQLETVVRELEDGETGLEVSLARYEQGIAILRHCYGKLHQVEARILELTGKDDAGQPITKPFEHASSMKQAIRETSR
jgi:exodeoxyribonuclease VII small subunit